MSHDGRNHLLFERASLREDSLEMTENISLLFYSSLRAEFEDFEQDHLESTDYRLDFVIRNLNSFILNLAGESEDIEVPLWTLGYKLADLADQKLSNRRGKASQVGKIT